MIFIAIPTFFVDVGKVVGFGWGTYSIALMILKLILVYFVFSILKEIARSYDNEALSKRTHNVFTTYMSVNLILFAFLSFSMNIPENPISTFSFILMIASFIMEIIFLVLIRAIRRGKPSKAIFDKIHRNNRNYSALLPLSVADKNSAEEHGDTCPRCHAEPFTSNENAK